MRLLRSASRFGGPVLSFLRLAARGVRFRRGLRIARGARIAGDVTIGGNTRINGPIRIVAIAPVSIGRYCAIGSDVTILSGNHDTQHANQQVALQRALALDVRVHVAAPIRIGNNVWIGDRVIVLAGVTVGHGAVLGAGSVVTKDVPAFAVVVGAPARVVRTRFSAEVVDALLRIGWWDWDRERIDRNRELLAADLTAIGPDELLGLVRA